VYAETLLPANRRSRLERNAAFSDLNYALYLGRSARPQQLLVTDVSDPPIRGRQAKDVVPFGDSALTLVVSARQPLGGTLPQRLPWIVLAVGVLLTLGAAELTRRLIHGRRNAEGLADRLEQTAAENERLYAEQRTIAVTLQRALLPAELPRLAGAEASARFEPGEQRVEIGGDWYDVIPSGGDQVLMVVGDVTGRGLGAAATMASLRYAIRAYAAEHDSPGVILTKLSQLLDVTADGRLATVLCARVDLARRRITLASAGHLPPLLVSDSHAEYIEGELGPPIGVAGNGNYASTTVAAPAAATLIAFTDGLIERRDETLDAGLARLRTAVGGADLALPNLLDQLIGQLRPTPADDDTAIVGIRWNTEKAT
jgi:serine phosphatase RsbU (regulator of sigma subunit)